jgi:hypothetical protein
LAPTMPHGLVGVLSFTRQTTLLIPMNRSLAAALCIGLAARLGDASAAAYAEDITADLITLDPAQASNGGLTRISVSDNKVRLDPAGFHGGFFIIDGDTGTATFVRPNERVFMDAKQSTPLTQIFVPLDPHAPCPQWKEMALSAGALEQEAEWRCALLGEDVVGGHTLHKYQMGPSEAQQRTVWLDPLQTIAVMAQSPGGTITKLENIKHEPQPAALFAIPPGYQKFEPQRLIDQIKQSDVWVEPPKK